MINKVPEGVVKLYHLNAHLPNYVGFMAMYGGIPGGHKKSTSPRMSNKKLG